MQNRAWRKRYARVTHAYPQRCNVCHLPRLSLDWRDDCVVPPVPYAHYHGRRCCVDLLLDVPFDPHCHSRVPGFEFYPMRPLSLVLAR